MDSFLEIEQIIQILRKLPGVSAKSAAKLALFFIDQDKPFLDELMKQLYNLNKNIGFCKKCNYLAHHENDFCCEICKNENRDLTKLCIVSNIQDLEQIEKTMFYDGLYYVLHGEVSWKNKNKFEDLKSAKLIERILSDSNIKEVIIATNPTMDGEITAKIIFKIFSEINLKLKIYRIGFGIPYNSEINYADEISLKQSLKNKQRIRKDEQ